MTEPAAASAEAADFVLPASAATGGGEAVAPAVRKLSVDKIVVDKGRDIPSAIEEGLREEGSFSDSFRLTSGEI